MQSKSKYNYGSRRTRTISPVGVKSQWTYTAPELNREVVNVIVASNTGDHVTPHPFQYTVNRYTQMQGMMSSNSGPGTWTTENEFLLPLGSPSIPSYSNLSAGQALVYNKTLSKLHEALRGKIDLSIDFGQYRQTSRMTAKYLTYDGIKKLAESLRSIRRMNYAGLGLALERRISPADFNIYFNKMRVTKQLDYNTALLKKLKKDGDAWKKYFTVPADLWLEWTYGWRPIASTIYEALDDLTETAMNEAEHAFECRVTIPYPKTDRRLYSLNAPYTAYISGKTSCTISAVTHTVRDVNNIATWTSLNPASIAWELMPYSFVVDWFYDVSSYLRSLETALLYSQVIDKVVVSELDVYDAQVEIADSWTLGSTRYKCMARGNSHYASFKRTVPASTTLLPRVPQFRAELGSSRLASAASLLAQFLKR